MRGEAIIARSIDGARIEDSRGNFWQYHSRSDRHSKIACVAILFDLLENCPLLRSHVFAGKVGFGINHELRDFKQNRKKNLDLVLCSRSADTTTTLPDYAAKSGLILTKDERSAFASLPVVEQGKVSNVLVALEAKACMTEHIKALPRLYDELTSSYQTVHGDTSGAIAAGYVLINCADAFVGPGRNPSGANTEGTVSTKHRQPAVGAATLKKVMEIARRNGEQESGFDAIGVTMLRCVNDGSTVEVDKAMNATVPKIATYDSLINRIAHLYGMKFGAL